MTAAAGTCTHVELIARVVALEAGVDAFEKLMNERDKRYEERASSQDKAVASALAAAEKAILKAETSTDKRLEGLNELKGMAADQAATFARGAEVKLALQAVDKRIDELAEMVRAREARGFGASQTWGYVVGAVGVLGVLFTLAVALLRPTPAPASYSGPSPLSGPAPTAVITPLKP